MNYCFFSAQYLPTAGGVERYTYNMACRLISLGHKVAVITSALPNLKNCETDENGIEIYRAKSWQLASGRLPWLLQDKGLKQFLNGFAAQRIIVQTQLYTLCLYGVKYANKNNIPVILLGHASGHIFSKKSIVKWGTDIYEHALSFLISRNKCSFYGVSQQSQKWFSHFKIYAADTVYNSLPQGLLNTKSNRRFISQGFIGTSVAFAGRLIAEKGIAQLCTAVSNLKQQGHDIHLYVVGEGDLYLPLKSKFSQSADFLGVLPHEDVLALLSQCHIYCLPSDAEGFPTALLEAAACGCYLITTPCGGSEELLADGLSGEIIDSNSSEYIEKALRFALQNKDIMAQKAENAAQKAQNQFSTAAAADKLISLFEK